MSDTTTVSGKCLCGAVTFKADVPEPHADVCHCKMCQTWSAGPAFALRITGTPEIAAADHVTVYKSSDWGERHFCKSCGTNLFWAAPRYNYFAVSAGTLDDTTALTFAMEIFIDKKPGYYAFANDTRQLTEAEFIEMMSGGAGTGHGDA